MSAIRVWSVVLLVTVLGACAPAPAIPSESPPGPLNWEPCGGENWPSTSRCADVFVPLDHADPGGARIPIRVSWTPAADPAHRRGVLVTNPGGPGTPGLRSAVSDRDVASPPVRAALDGYDLVGFDPRGTGESAPVACGLTAAQQIAVRAPTPDRNGPERDAQAAASVADACARRGGPLLAHMSTVDVARDLDLIRSALGAPTFTYYGSSYGTYLGVVYDTLFPGRAGRMVLDSLVDSQHGWYAQDRRTALATERRFDDFAGWAAVHTAGVGDSPGAVRDRYLALAADRDRTPLTLPAGAVVDGATVRRVTYALVGRDRFAPLAAFLRCAGAPQGGACPAVLAGAANDLGESAGDAADAGVSTYLAVRCSDSPWPRDPAAYRRAAAEDAARYPVTAGGFAQIGPCATWPVPARPTVTATYRPGPPRILLVNNTHDRISELGGALSTRNALGPQARLVTVDGWNHQILSNGVPCADRYLAEQLGDGPLPAGDVTCPAR